MYRGRDGKNLEIQLTLASSEGMHVASAKETIKEILCDSVWMHLTSKLQSMSCGVALHKNTRNCF